MSPKDAAAEAVAERLFDFEMALSDKRRYPKGKFTAFASAVRRYVDLTLNDELVHRKVVSEIHGLAEHLRMERKRVPEDVLWEAERLECLVFAGYDPHFEGDEPPGL